MKILSPAKINLMLRILGQREDGYHLLQTYFQLLDWGDFIDFTLTDIDKVSILGDFGTLRQEDNLIYKAAKLLEPHRRVSKGIKISVDKNIPQGSGLGGGSSNAGMTLRILNKIWECQLNQEQLKKIGLTLGADVPIFVLNTSAMATGIGENLTSFSIKNYYFVLIFPKTSISTAEVFNNENLKKNQSSINIDSINDKNNWTNTCLSVVLNNFSEIKNMYSIASKISPIYMSGTGSTLFSCFESQSKALHFIKQCPAHWNTQICQSKINQ